MAPNVPNLPLVAYGQDYSTSPTDTRHMLIERCVCHAITFKDLKLVSEQEDVTDLEALQKLREFGTGCGLCKPYVREMLRTGRTEFDAIITEDDSA
ncbi:MAG: bacterioferritin-associated ferredoxin [Rhodothermales bacterium]|jgi:bacterioferritin-associated ferredoxin